MRKLTEKINSDYFESRNALYKSKGNFVSVMVENEDDIPFWKYQFDQFNILTRIYPASKSDLIRGKAEVLKQHKEAGPFLLLAVDSDLDYILPGVSPYSSIIQENQYIFQTYTYSIENYFCYSESLHQVLVDATYNDNQIFDFEQFMKSYSKIVYDLFVICLFFEQQGDKLTPQSFPLKMFNKVIKLQEEISLTNHGEGQLAALRDRIQIKIETLPAISQDQIYSIRKALSRLGASPENIYLFIPGHIVFDNVTMMFLNPLYRHLRQEKMNLFSSLSASQKEIKDKKRQYQNDTEKNLLPLLKSHKYYYHTCFLSEKIKDDIRQYIHLQTQSI